MAPLKTLFRDGANRARAWWLEDIALSNFIAASVRDMINAQMEMWFDWPGGGAFNGAAWLLDDGSAANIMFYRAWHPRFRLLHFSLGKIVTNVPSRHRPLLTGVISAAESRFRERVRSEGSWLLSSVARLQVLLRIPAATLASAEASAENAVAALRELLKAAASRTSPKQGPSDTWQVDLDFRLARPQQHDAIVALLSSVLGSITGSMFGRGAILEAGNGRSAGRLSGRIIARQA